MTNLCCEVIRRLQGCTLVTAESCTGGGIGAALTAIPGSSRVYKGGIISYTNWVKEHLLDVDPIVLERDGAVSESVAIAMARGARQKLEADIAVSVTGLAGPGADDYGNPVGTVYIGYADETGEDCRAFHFSGTREEIRALAQSEALLLVLAHIPGI